MKTPSLIIKSLIAALIGLCAAIGSQHSATAAPGLTADLATVPETSVYEASLLKIDNPLRKSKGGEAIGSIVGLGLLVGLGMGAWSVFRPGNCNSFFDNLAGRRVTNCSKATYWRPLIVFLVFCMVGKATDDIAVALSVAGAYEAVLIAFRTASLRSLRAAVVEALYLFIHGMGAVFFCYILLIFAFLASGNSSSGSKRKEESGRCCDCRKWRDQGNFNGYCTCRCCETHAGQSCHNFVGSARTNAHGKTCAGWKTFSDSSKVCKAEDWTWWGRGFFVNLRVEQYEYI